jgi:hypothetical protein
MYNDDRRTSPRTGAGARLGRPRLGPAGPGQRVQRAAPLPARACLTHEEW